MSKFVLVMTLIVSIKSETRKPIELLGNAVTNCSTETPVYLVNTVNVNTVLFKDSDLQKTCWNTEDIVLLATRQEMQGLIPKKAPENITTLLEYYKLSLETINLVQTNEGSEKTLLLSAFADAIGGYLKQVGIPLTNEAYYAGRIDYVAAKQIHDLFDAVKQFLHTTGEGWHEPMQPPFVLNRVQPIDLSFTDERGACDEFITTKAANSGTADLLPIPMPYLDDEKNPNSVALPFRFRSLFSLGNGNTTDVLLQYYQLGLTCLATSYAHQDIHVFNKRLESWILKSVVPHLEETKWYPGFWGVKKIIETMKRLDSEEIKLPTTRRLFITDITDRASTKCFKTTIHKPSTTATTTTVPSGKNQTTFLWFFSKSQVSNLKKLTLGTLLAIALYCALALLLPYVLYLALCGRRSGSQQSLPRESEMELLNTLVALYWELRESNEKKDRCHLGNKPVRPNFDKFKKFWIKGGKVPPTGTIKSPDLSRGRSVRFENPSIESLPVGGSEPIEHFGYKMFDSE